MTSDEATVVRPFVPRYDVRVHVSEMDGDKRRTNKRQQIGHNGAERLFGRMVGRAHILKHFADEGDEGYVKDTVEFYVHVHNLTMKQEDATYIYDNRSEHASEKINSYLCGFLVSPSKRVSSNTEKNTMRTSDVLTRLWTEFDTKGSPMKKDFSKISAPRCLFMREDSEYDPINSVKFIILTRRLLLISFEFLPFHF